MTLLRGLCVYRRCVSSLQPIRQSRPCGALSPIWAGFFSLAALSCRFLPFLFHYFLIDRSQFYLFGSSWLCCWADGYIERGRIIIYRTFKGNGPSSQEMGENYMNTRHNSAVTSSTILHIKKKVSPSFCLKFS